MVAKNRTKSKAAAQRYKSQGKSKKKSSASEERKSRQDKFRKRKKSLRKKTKELAELTDCWVALFIVDKAGSYETIRASDNPSWPASIDDIIRKHPSGNHEYLPKDAISALPNILTDEDEELIVDEIRTMSVDNIGVGTRPNSPATASPCCVDKPKQAEVNTKTTRSSPNSTAVETIEPEETAGELPRASNYSTVEFYDTIEIESESFDCEAMDLETSTFVVAQEASQALPTTTPEEASQARLPTTTSEEASQAHLPTTTPAARQTDHRLPTTNADERQINQLPLATPEVENNIEEDIEVEVDHGDPFEAAMVLHAMQHPSESLGSWEVVNSPRMIRQVDRQDTGLRSLLGIDAQSLFDGWNYIFQRK